MTVPKMGSTARPGRGLIVALVVMGLCLGGAIAMLFYRDHQNQQAISDLVGLSQSKENTIDALCKNKPKDPTCRQAQKIPDTSDVVDNAEIQDAEVQDPEIQDPEIQDPEKQNPEGQDAEQQNPETQEGEVQDPDPDDPDPDDPDPDDPEIQDPEIDDPDPNSLLEFAVSDNCTPADGQFVTDVGLQVSRGNGVVTYTVTCQTEPIPPAAGP